MAGNLNVTWIHGSANCTGNTDPPIQIHQFDPDTFILRQSKCSDPGNAAQPGSSFEAPFLYLLFGTSKALLLDSGATASAARFPVAAAVNKIRSDRAARLGKPVVPLLIAHSHSHGDHAAGDAQFQGQPGVSIVPLGLAGVKQFFQLPQWPNGRGTIDLGGRILDVIPAPGHEPSHIAIYDRRERLLLSGDTLYPGLLVVNDWRSYRRTAARLAAFAATNPVSHVLGAHIEMTAQAGRWFGLGTLFQPGEHRLELTQAHLTEWNAALQAIGAQPRLDRRADFIIYPAGPPLPPLGP